MAVTKGHGNPKWTRDETILALDLYFDCEGKMPSGSDERVQELSLLLRSFPYHVQAARKDSFRNPDGVAFKLQNLRSVATGKGLGNTSKMDRQLWDELGGNRNLTKQLANQIRSSIKIIEGIEEEPAEDEIFFEGRIVTELHSRRERNPRLRKELLKARKKQGELKCDMCSTASIAKQPELAESMYEVHHIVPLSESSEKHTKIEDMALLCACCHKIIHRAISLNSRWFSIDEAKLLVIQSDRSL